MKYVVAIPTYKRVDTIIENTLKTLEESNVPPENIYIFVANKEEYTEYNKKVPPNIYNKIIIGKETLHKQRNYIRQYFQENTNIFYIDDDIQGFYKLQKNKLIKYNKLDQLIQAGFHICKKYHSTLMGIYPVFNHFFMSNTINKGLYYVIGSAYWNINKKDKKLNVTIEDKEDYERSLKEYLYSGQVLRLNNITAKTNYYTEPGGMQETRTEDRITKSAYYLKQKYPEYVSINKARKKHTEIKFKKQENNEKIGGNNL